MIIITDINKDINTNELLKYLVQNDIINLDDVQKDMEEKKKQQILSKHKYNIFQDKDGRWKTNMPDKTTKTGRRLVAKTSYEKLEKVILEYYLNEEDKGILPELKTLREIYPQWLKYKYAHTASSSYIKRLDNDWKKYYVNDSIIDVPLYKLNYIQLDLWAHQLVTQMALTKKQYFNMATIMRQCLDYCLDMNYIANNPFQRVKIDKKLFTKKPKPKNYSQVFLEDEEIALCKYLLDEYERKPHILTPLAIVLNFQLGLRIGELVALKWDDIENNYIHVQRMEVATYDINDEVVVKNGADIAEYTKSDAGEREVYINSEAQKILKLIKKSSMKHSLHSENFIFVNPKCKRITISSLEKYLYRRCEKINIAQKSSHKIRKTYISSLFDKGLNVDAIRELAGHEDERTSLNNYCFNRKNTAETEKLLEKDIVKVI